MSYFSGQLRRLIEQGFTQAELAGAAKISQGQFSKYVKGSSIPDAESMEKLCKALPEKERTELTLARLLDEIPQSSRELVSVIRQNPAETSARVREEPQLSLAPQVQEAFAYFMRRAQHDNDVADWIVAAYNIVKPEA